MPRFRDIDWRGLAMDEVSFKALTRVDLDAWRDELALQMEWFDKLGERVPQPLRLKHQLLMSHLPSAAAG
jgi:phosphoenolpyruvate carboxykinase (GTP)